MGTGGRLTTASNIAQSFIARLAALPVRNTPAVRAVRREYSRTLLKAEAELVIEVAQRIAAYPGTGARFAGYELLACHQAAFQALSVGQLIAFGREMQSWDAVDCFGIILSGPAWRDGKLSDRLIQEWAGSDDCWWRRAALVSTIALSRGGESTWVAKALKICGLLVQDQDDMVVKALSWALREIAKQSPEQADRFLSDHEEMLAARVKREVRNKIATGLKQPRRSK